MRVGPSGPSFLIPDQPAKSGETTKGANPGISGLLAFFEGSDTPFIKRLYFRSPCQSGIFAIVFPARNVITPASSRSRGSCTIASVRHEIASLPWVLTLTTSTMTVGLSRPSETHESRRMAQLSKKRIVTRPTGSSSQEATVHTDIRPIVERINTNPIIDKADLTRLLHDLLTPLEACQSPGGARIKLGHSGAGFDHIAAELEGFARALWGLAPLLASEPHHPLFRSLRTKWVTGLINGTDPASSEYWGDCHDRDQRMVDQAAIVRQWRHFHTGCRLI